jgi:hypothetical protein
LDRLRIEALLDWNRHLDRLAGGLECVPLIELTHDIGEVAAPILDIPQNEDY